jgi:HD-GYP domain-containing protein (c-di-GMP phosphodiesterase class II)
VTRRSGRLPEDGAASVPGIAHPAPPGPVAVVRPPAAALPADVAAAYRRINLAYEQALRYAEDVRRLYVLLQRGIYQSLLGLANALEAKDPYTRGHSERVSRTSGRIAAALAVEASQVDVIGQAGLLHDIGKIGVPEHVLRKPGALTPDEWALMRRHPVVGADIVAPLEFFAAGALVIRYHHERWDGSGYPEGLRGQAIPLGARIIAVADVWDALTSDRPYRPALTAADAEDVLESEAGRALDRDVVASFRSLRRADRIGGGVVGHSTAPGSVLSTD